LYNGIVGESHVGKNKPPKRIDKNQQVLRNFDCCIFVYL
jgi:hypothetical protein